MTRFFKLKFQFTLTPLRFFKPQFRFTSTPSVKIPFKAVIHVVRVTCALTIVLLWEANAMAHAQSPATPTSASQEFGEISRMAGVPAPKNLRVGEESYPRQDIIQDFVNIAISKYGWLDDAAERYRLPQWFTGDYELTRQQHPVLAEYLFRRSGYPAFRSINKWDGEITIGIDWPRVEVPVSSGDATAVITASGLNPWGEDNTEAYPLFEHHIASLVPAIARLTKLPVTLVDPDDPREVVHSAERVGPEGHARIRVVPTRLIGSRTWFPMHGGTIERYFLAGVPFTPFELGQVDGYLLPNADNTIGFAACRINPDLHDDLIRSLITECLVRVLGLPGLPTHDGPSMINHWHGKLDLYFRTLLKKSSDRDRTEGSAEITILRDSAKHVQASRPTTYPVQFSAFDEFMIALLYCPAIKPGMNVYEVIQILNADNHCLDETR